MDKPIIARREVTNHILHTFKLKADKRLGQNFLIDSQGTIVAKNLRGEALYEKISELLAQ